MSITVSLATSTTSQIVREERFWEDQLNNRIKQIFRKPFYKGDIERHAHQIEHVFSIWIVNFVYAFGDLQTSSVNCSQV